MDTRTHAHSCMDTHTQAHRPVEDFAIAALVNQDGPVGKLTHDLPARINQSPSESSKYLDYSDTRGLNPVPVQDTAPTPPFPGQPIASTRPGQPIPTHASRAADRKHASAARLTSRVLTGADGWQGPEEAACRRPQVPQLKRQF